ncbi:unnamed protein product, partial [Musa hybrid cultivar]
RPQTPKPPSPSSTRHARHQQGRRGHRLMLHCNHIYGMAYFSFTKIIPSEKPITLFRRAARFHLHRRCRRQGLPLRPQHRREAMPCTAES